MCDIIFFGKGILKINKIGKIIIGLGVAGGLFIGGALGLYLKGLPYAISHPKVIKYAQNAAKQYVDADLIIEKPVLKTKLSSDIAFKVETIYLGKNNKKLLELKDFYTELSFREILAKNLIVKKLLAKNIYADVNGIMNLLPQQEEKEKQPSDWNVDIFEALLGVKDCEILYDINNDTTIHLKGHRIGVNNAQKVKKNVYFQLFANVKRKDKSVDLELKDNDRVFFEDNLFHIENCPLSINKSNIFINLTADRKRNFDIDPYSKNFNLNDILDFLNTQIIENNVQDMLVYFNDIQGNLNFNLNIKNDDLKGNFKLNNLKFKVKDVDNIPITLTKGIIDLSSTDIQLKDFEGYYDNNPQNKMAFAGTVKDYLNTMEMDLKGNASARNDFFKNHLTRMAGSDFEMKGEAKTLVKIKSKNNIFDIVWYFMLKPGQNIKVGTEYLPFEDTFRLMKSDMHFENMILDIKSLDYHMVEADKFPDRETMKKQRKENKKPVPIFRLSSSIDIAHNNHIKFIGFEIPDPLPSELLNVVLKQDMFKKGKIGGKLLIDNKGKYPVLSGNMNMDRVIIPSQMTYIKEATLETKNNLIHLNALGGYRFSRFKFNGDILNELKFPIIVKDVNLSLEKIDALKLLEAFNNQDAAEDVITTDQGVIKAESSEDEFDIRNVIVEKCRFHLDKGIYKDIEFGNLDADLTLNKDGVIDIKSNRFDFADGQSSLRTNFDLINKKYNVKLGILNVESNTIAKTLLDLDREIFGKASGFLDLTTNDSMKLSGSIIFKIAEGSIEKIGLVEYVLKAAAIFRNPITMISPAIFSDLFNVPDGSFEKITGVLKLENNVVTTISIKTYSPQLSTYIAGRYNLDNGDTSLRIYTKFSNIKRGIAGFWRRLSLNSLATRIPLSSRNDANYYAIELKELPDIDADEKDCQIFLTKVEGDVAGNNYISSLKKIK